MVQVRVTNVDTQANEIWDDLTCFWVVIEVSSERNVEVLDIKFNITISIWDPSIDLLSSFDLPVFD